LSRRFYLPLALAALLLLTGGCARQLKKGEAAPEPELTDSIVAAARGSAPKVTEFKGFGEIAMAAGAGQRISGQLDAHRRGGGFFRAQVYSPFGTTVASISADDFTGRVNVNREVFEFAYDDAMDSVPFPCARYFTYGRFIRTMTGSMPEVFWTLPPTPDSVAKGKKKKAKGKNRAVTAVWTSDTLTVRAAIVPQTGQIESAAFNYNIGEAKFSIQYGAFKKGMASEILIKEGSRNYISIKYETMVGQ
jgi:hypothetical protein